MDLTPLVQPGQQVIESYGAGGFRVSGVGLSRRRPGVSRPHRAWEAAAATIESLAPVVEHGGVEIAAAWARPPHRAGQRRRCAPR